MYLTPSLIKSSFTTNVISNDNHGSGNMNHQHIPCTYILFVVSIVWFTYALQCFLYLNFLAHIHMYTNHQYYSYLICMAMLNIHSLYVNFTRYTHANVLCTCKTYSQQQLIFKYLYCDIIVHVWQLLHYNQCMPVQPFMQLHFKYFVLLDKVCNMKPLMQLNTDLKLNRKGAKKLTMHYVHIYNYSTVEP